jgi:prepilin-type N-terminal cleavage/methylation domain-containing protein
MEGVKMLKMLRSKKGFTLLELVIVVALIGIMMAVLLPKVGGTKDQMKIAVDKQSISMVNECISLYCASNNYDNLIGQTSINCFRPIKEGEAAESIVTFLQDKGLLSSTAKIYFPQGHSYDAVENKLE